MEALVEALAHTDAGVRAESAAALAELRDPAAIEALLRATHDDEHAVRRQAGIALDRLGTTAVIAGLAEMLEPMIGEAVRSAVAQRPTRQSRSRRTNGAEDGRTPAAQSGNVPTDAQRR